MFEIYILEKWKLPIDPFDRNYEITEEFYSLLNYCKDERPKVKLAAGKCLNYIMSMIYNKFLDIEQKLDVLFKEVNKRFAF